MHLVLVRSSRNNGDAIRGERRRRRRQDTGPRTHVYAIAHVRNYCFGQARHDDDTGATHSLCATNCINCTLVVGCGTGVATGGCQERARSPPPTTMQLFAVCVCANALSCKGYSIQLNNSIPLARRATQSRSAHYAVEAVKWKSQMWRSCARSSRSCV